MDHKSAFALAVAAQSPSHVIGGHVNQSSNVHKTIVEE